MTNRFQWRECDVVAERRRKLQCAIDAAGAGGVRSAASAGTDTKHIGVHGAGPIRCDARALCVYLRKRGETDWGVSFAGLR